MKQIPADKVDIAMFNMLLDTLALERLNHDMICEMYARATGQPVNQVSAQMKTTLRQTKKSLFEDMLAMLGDLSDDLPDGIRSGQ